MYLRAGQGQVVQGKEGKRSVVSKGKGSSNTTCFNLQYMEWTRTL